MKRAIRLLLTAACLAVPALAVAQNEPGEHHFPSPAALAACKDKGAGDACEFDGHRGHVSGTCRKVRSGDLACVHHHHGEDAGAE